MFTKFYQNYFLNLKVTIKRERKRISFTGSITKEKKSLQKYKNKPTNKAYPPFQVFEM